MAAESGMGFGTKALLWVGGAVALLYAVPAVLDAAARNPRKLRSAASATRRARSRAFSATKRGVSKTGRYLADKVRG